MLSFAEGYFFTKGEEDRMHQAALARDQLVLDIQDILAEDEREPGQSSG